VAKISQDWNSTVGVNLPGAEHVEPLTGDWYSAFGLSTSRRASILRMSLFGLIAATLAITHPP